MMCKKRIEANQATRQAQWRLHKAAESAPLDGLSGRILFLRAELKAARDYELSLNPYAATNGIKEL